MTAPVKTKLLRTVGGLDLHLSDTGNLYVTAAGDIKVVGGAWGPAADGTGNWFAWRAPADPIRVDDRDAALELITAPVEVAAR